MTETSSAAPLAELKKMPLDATSLCLSLLFGLVGWTFFQFGRKNGRPVPLGVGLSLMIVPYFLPSTPLMAAVCVTLCALPAVLPWAR